MDATRQPETRVLSLHRDTLEAVLDGMKALGWHVQSVIEHGETRVVTLIRERAASA